MVTASPVRGEPGDPAPRPSGSRSWDTASPPARGQVLLVGVALLAAPLGALATALRVFPPRSDAPALLASFISYGLLAYAVAFGCLVMALTRARRRQGLAILTAACAALVAIHIAWLAPLFVPDNRPVATESFVVMSLNLRHGAADPQQMLAAAASADIVVLPEATPESARRLAAVGWRDRFPHVVGDPLRTGPGSPIYSRYPLTDPEALPRSAFPQWAATAAVPEVGPVRVIAAHPCNPFCGDNRWAAEHDTLRAVATAVPPELPLVLAGDLNAVPDHGPLQALHRTGLTTAADLTGAGWLPTYPAQSLLPPLLPIDHVVVDDQLTALSVSRIEVAGTDHLGLVAELAGTR